VHASHACTQLTRNDFRLLYKEGLQISWFIIISYWDGRSLYAIQTQAVPNHNHWRWTFLIFNLCKRLPPPRIKRLFTPCCAGRLILKLLDSKSWFIYHVPNNVSDARGGLMVSALDSGPSGRNSSTFRCALGQDTTVTTGLSLYQVYKFVQAKSILAVTLQ